jgi:hypothetical protein
MDPNLCLMMSYAQNSLLVQIDLKGLLTWTMTSLSYDTMRHSWDGSRLGRMVSCNCKINCSCK